MADHVIIATPPATYTQWFKDDPVLISCAPWNSQAITVPFMAFDEA